MTPTVQDIIQKYLKDNGYDGLFQDEGCACEADGMALCGSACDDIMSCIPGYMVECGSGDYEFHICPDRQETCECES